jgi:predicted DNA-binding transcriptional regulator AlpA
MQSIPAQFSDRLTVSIPEAALMLGIKAKTLYNQVSAGSCPFPTLKLGGRRLVRVHDLLDLTGAEYPLRVPEPTRAQRKSR